MDGETESKPPLTPERRRKILQHGGFVHITGLTIQDRGVILRFDSQIRAREEDCGTFCDAPEGRIVVTHDGEIWIRPSFARTGDAWILERELSLTRQYKPQIELREGYTIDANAYARRMKNPFYNYTPKNE